MIEVRSLAVILTMIGISMIISGSITLSYIIHQSDTIDDYVNKINDLEKKNKDLERDYKYERGQAEYWYYYSVNDAC
jgi:hypothetical protein